VDIHGGLLERGGKNVAQLVLYVKCSLACTGDIRVMELFTGITEQESSNQ